MRIDGYARIEDYAVIGDGRTAALVALDGAIDWLCLPNFDSPSVLGAIVDAARGGAFELQPTIPFGASRRYLPGTNLLETTFDTDAGKVRVVDAMTLPGEGLEPLRELARSIEGLSGRVPMRWRFAPRFNYGAEMPRCGWRGTVPVTTRDRDAVAVVSWDAGTPVWLDHILEARFETSEGSRALIALASAFEEPLLFPGRRAVERRLEDTQRFWQQWTEARTYDGPWRDPVLRSALVLKLLVFAPSGATVAAPTTSLPEEIGGQRNWDYRFCWIRDSNFAIAALMQLGCHQDAQRLLWWFMQATALTEPELQVLYRLDGGPGFTEHDTGLSGYRGSRPVRVGNSAVEQDQLDIYGALFEMAWLYSQGERALDHDTAAVLGRLADHVCNIWRRPDSGIWEVRNGPFHFTHSKVMCWLALDRAVRLAERGELPSRRASRWAAEAAAIRHFIDRECWSERLRTYTRTAGGESVDASLLMLPIVGYRDPRGERTNGTIDAVMRTLGDREFIYRYRDDDGVPGGEGCFLNCSFWLVSALARAGRVDEASKLMERLIARANDVGLYSEEIDARTGGFLGNFPQALVHLTLIEAASAIHRASTGQRQIT